MALNLATGSRIVRLCCPFPSDPLSSSLSHALSLSPSLSATESSRRQALRNFSSIDLTFIGGSVCVSGRKCVREREEVCA